MWSIFWKQKEDFWSIYFWQSVGFLQHRSNFTFNLTVQWPVKVSKESFFTSRMFPVTSHWSCKQRSINMEMTVPSYKSRINKWLTYLRRQKYDFKHDMEDGLKMYSTNSINSFPSIANPTLIPQITPALLS